MVQVGAGFGVGAFFCPEWVVQVGACFCLEWVVQVGNQKSELSVVVVCGLVVQLSLVESGGSGAWVQTGDSHMRSRHRW